MYSLPKRKRNRLQSYDYSENGAYFVTICTKNKQKLFWNVGAISDRPHGTVPLSEYGEIVQQAINEINNFRLEITVVNSVVMPNHVHLLLIFEQWENGRSEIAPTDLSNVVRFLKSYVTKRIGFSPWQKSFHDHVVRNQAEYNTIWEYIDQNPETWETDCFFIDY